jgi:RNA recognition motif-containing protein
LRRWELGDPREEHTITAKLFVGNLDFNTTRGELERLFGEVGELVSVSLPSDRETGRPRGFAFVEFADAAVADAAAQRFDGYELNGRNLRVNEAQEKGLPRDFSGGGPSHGMPPRRSKPKGSRRNLRARKRSL